MENKESLESRIERLNKEYRKETLNKKISSCEIKNRLFKVMIIAIVAFAIFYIISNFVVPLMITLSGLVLKVLLIYMENQSNLYISFFGSIFLLVAYWNVLIWLVRLIGSMGKWGINYYTGENNENR